ncbi:MAG: 23S rRNA (adenine(2030)-N(6))-methyltransferase RlmJ [Myxococcota bacterium]
MLAYRHGYHAGNHADVLKHAVFVHILDHLARKGPFAIIDTHAGPGAYDLSDTQGQKLREYETGIARILQASSPPPLISRYLETVTQFRNAHGRDFYPGTAALALMLRRRDDRLVLHELHPTDFERLNAFVRGHRHTSVNKADGFKGALAHVPPKERRGVVVMDPSYELKTDYDRAIDTVRHAHRKFGTGVFVLWYPVVRRQWVIEMDRALETSGLRKIWRGELSVVPDTEEHGMTGSGIYVVNPPYTLPEVAEAALPWLARALSPSEGAFNNGWLVPE